jgi:hypothetical protein
MVVPVTGRVGFLSKLERIVTVAVGTVNLTSTAETFDSFRERSVKPACWVIKACGTVSFVRVNNGGIS